MKKYAVIDIGSNSVRLMLWADGALYKKVETTRLSEGLSESGLLSEAAMQRSERAVAAFCEEGRRAGARPVAFATAAVRSASNGWEFCARVRALCGLDIDVVAGEDEAQMGLLGALGANDGAVIDIGGASTEVGIRARGVICFLRSLPIGAVRIREECGQSFCMIDAFVDMALRGFRTIGTFETCYAIGGTAATLAAMWEGLPAYDAQKLNGLKIPYEFVKEAAIRIFMTPLEARKDIPGMDPKRVDIILGGTVLLFKLMERMHISSVRFSDADNLEGYLALRGLV